MNMSRAAQVTYFLLRVVAGFLFFQAGAVILLPTYAESEKVFEHHLIAVRTELDNFGIADPTVFAAKLHKAG